MWEWCFGGYDAYGIFMLIASAVLIGVNKTGVPGLGMLPVLMLASAFPARESTGIQLLMLGAADVMAVIYYRRHANWKIVLRLMPWALAGIVMGSVALRFISDAAMKPVLAWTILFMAVFSYLMPMFKKMENMPEHWAFSACFGILAGLTTQVANAAGPVMAVYLLAMRLPKAEYMGSAAWYFLILNWIKIPIFIWEGRITMSSLRTDLPMIPFLLIGGALGIFLLSKLPQRQFEEIVKVLVMISALKMLIWG